MTSGWLTQLHYKSQGQAKCLTYAIEETLTAFIIQASAVCRAIHRVTPNSHLTLVLE